ncbi:hypothetical protein DEFR109230_19790 [Deinococcus frigens]
MKDFPNVVAVVPDVKVPTDEIRDPAGCPRIIGKAMLRRTLPQEGAKLLELAGGQT